MSPNRISATLPDETFQRLLTSLAFVKEHLPFLVHLSVEERRRLPKMGDKNYAFVEKSLGHSQTAHHLYPPFLDQQEFQRDFALYNQLAELIRLVNNLKNGLESTQLLVKSECFIASLAFYQSVKAAKDLNVPDAKAIYEDLRQSYPGRGPSRNKPTSSGSDEVPPLS